MRAGPLASRRRLVVAGLAAAILLGTGAPVFADGILPANNPKSNIAPVPNFLESGPCTTSSAGWTCQNPCVTSQLEFPTYTTGTVCTNYVLGAVSAARKVEGLGAMVLPTNWSTLTPQEQLFVLADIERVDRGLPPYLGLNWALSHDAQHAAQNDSDPWLAHGFAVGLDAQGDYGMGGTWGTGYTTLGADYFWMYDDGWGGSAATTSNVSCTSATAPACWAHRDELLGYDPRFNPGVGLWCHTCEMGTGFAVTNGYSSFVDLVELPAGAPPAMTFTWAKDVLPYFPKPAPPAAPQVAPRHVNPKQIGHRNAWSTFVSPGTHASLCLMFNAKHHWGPTACRSNSSRRASL